MAILVSVLSSLVHLVGIFLYNLPHPRASAIATYGVRLATRICMFALGGAGICIGLLPSGIK